MPPASRLIHCSCWQVLLLMILFGGPSAQAQPATSSAGPPQRLVLALDGIPFDVFAELQQRGYFKAFRPVARMVSTFPSLSDVSFAAIDGNEPPDGYQTTHFDPLRNELVGNTLSSLSERSHPKIASDSRRHATLHRVMGYVAPTAIARRELREIADDLQRSRKQTFVAYLGTSDAVLHLQGRAGAEQFLKDVDAFLLDLQLRTRARTGRDLLIDIVSDHGSTMVESQVVPVAEALERCGFRRRGKMQSPRDAAFSLPGIVGSVAISLAPQHVEEAGRCLARVRGVDLVAVNRGEAVGVLAGNMEAELRQLGDSPERYAYRAVRGDPLGLLPPGATDGDSQTFEQAKLFAQTLDASRPDPLRRLWRAFHGEVKKPSSLLVSLADGYEVGNPALRAMTRLRGGHAGTHGSMTRLASLGVLASNWRAVEDVNAAGAHAVLFGPDTLAQLQQRARDVQPAALQESASDAGAHAPR